MKVRGEKKPPNIKSVEGLSGTRQVKKLFRVIDLKKETQKQNSPKSRERGLSCLYNFVLRGSIGSQSNVLWRIELKKSA